MALRGRVPQFGGVSGGGNPTIAAATITVAGPQVGATGTVTLPAIIGAWSVAGASYGGVSRAVNDVPIIPADVTFSADGTKMYIVGTVDDGYDAIVQQYSLSTAWNINSASPTAYFETSFQDLYPTDVAFSADGTKMYVVGSGTSKVYQYSLSTAWNISSASYGGVLSFSVAGQEAQPNALAFSVDGTKMYVAGVGNDTIYQYSLSTAWNVSSASFGGVSFSVAGQEAQPNALAFKPDGSRMYVVGSAADTIYQYSLSTAWNVSSASYDGVSFSVGAQESSPTGLAFKPDGLRMYVVGGAATTVYQYDLSFNGTATIAVSGPVVGATGTVGVPQITGSAGISLGGPRVAATGVISIPQITGSAGITVSGPAIGATGAISIPAITGSAGISLGGPRVAATGLASTLPAITGNATIGLNGPQVTAIGVISIPPITGSVGVSLGGPIVAATGTISIPPITGSAGIVINGPKIEATGLVSALPAITGSANITVQGPVIGAAGTISIPAITGSVGVNVGGPRVAAVGTISIPAITGSVGIGLSGPQVAAIGIISIPAITGSAAIAVSGPTIGATGAISIPAITGSAGIVINGSKVEATGLVSTIPAITGSVGISLGGPRVAAVGTVSIPAITGSAAIAVSGPTIGATGAISVPAITGSATIGLNGPKIEATGLVSTIPAITGSVGISLGGPRVAAVGTVSIPTITGSVGISLGGPRVTADGTISIPPITGSIAIGLNGPRVTASGLVSTLPAITGSAAIAVSGPTIGATGTISIPATSVFYPSNSAIIKSPSNWHFTGIVNQQAAETVWPGSYMRLRFDGDAIAINVDTSGLSAYPWVLYQIDAESPVVVKLTAGQTVINITGLSIGAHELNIIYQAKDDHNQVDTWGDAQKLRILSFSPSGGTGLLAAPVTRPKKAIIYGDAIAAGLKVTAPPGVTTMVGLNAATGSYANHIGIGLDAEFDQCGSVDDGWTIGGVGGFPSLPASWNLKKPGVSRNISTHDYVVVIHGYNDGALDIASSVVTNWLTSIRAATTAWIFLCVPFSGRQRGAITTGVANYISANPTETKIKVIDLGSTFYQSIANGYYTTDSIHPNSWQAGRLASAYLGLMNRELLTNTSVGTMPATNDVRFGVTVGSSTGTLRVPTPNQVLAGVQVDATIGTVVLPVIDDVRAGVSFGAANILSGTLEVSPQVITADGIGYSKGTKVNLVIDQGSDYYSILKLADANNNVFNLTGYTVSAQIRKNYSANTSYNFTTSHNNINGEVTLFMNNVITEALEPGRYVYDVEVTSPGNIITRIMEGVVTVTPGVTRNTGVSLGANNTISGIVSEPRPKVITTADDIGYSKAAKLNLIINQGSDYRTIIKLADANNDIFDLTGYTITAQMRKNYSSDTVYNFMTSHNNVNGEVTLFVNNTTTEALEPGRYVYDVEVTSPVNIITRVIEGIVTITPGVTRSI